MPAHVFEDDTGAWYVPRYGDRVRVSSRSGAKSLMRRWGHEDVVYVAYEVPASERVAKEKVTELEIQVIAEDLLAEHSFENDGPCDGCGTDWPTDDSRLCEDCYFDGLYSGLVMEAAHDGRLVRRSA